MKKILNKWQFIFNYGEEPNYYNPFLRILDFGIIKLTSIPKEGDSIKKRKYKGFLISVSFFIPIKFN